MKTRGPLTLVLPSFFFFFSVTRFIKGVVTTVWLPPPKLKIEPPPHTFHWHHRIAMGFFFPYIPKSSKGCGIDHLDGLCHFFFGLGSTR